MRRKGKIPLRWPLLASALLGLGAALPVYLRMSQECVLCRSERVEYRIAGISFPTGLTQDKEFTRWYFANRAAREHKWWISAPGCLVERNFFGLILSFSMIRHHPIHFMKPDQELAFVRVQDSSAIEKFFTSIASDDIDISYPAVESAKKQLADAK